MAGAKIHGGDSVESSELGLCRAILQAESCGMRRGWGQILRYLEGQEICDDPSFDLLLARLKMRYPEGGSECYAVANMANRYGIRIKKLRDDLEKSREEVADAADISYSYFGAVERGDRPPLGPTATTRIAEALGVPAEELIRLAKKDWLEIWMERDYGA